MRIEGRVAVVTGAERGLGWALAVELARKGARVVASGLAREPLERLRTTIERTGGRAMATVCDVRDPDQTVALVAEATQTLGPPDLLVNNAGVTIGGDIRLITEQDWEEALAVNLLGAVRMVQAVLPGMLSQKRGAIVNIASAAGLVAPALWIPYAASKFALVGFSEGLHAALRPRGIMVSVVCPLWIETEMLTSTRPRLLDTAPPVPTMLGKGAGWAWLTSRARGPHMAPEAAARRIVRSIEHERFMIYTHRVTRILVAARALAPEMFARLWQRANEADERRHRAAAQE